MRYKSSPSRKNAKPKSSMRSVIVALWVTILTGCAAPASIDRMSVSLPISKTNPALKNNIGVSDVTGGRETNPMWTSQVSSEGFRSALEKSLENTQMLSKIVSAGKYQLTADLSRLDQPFIGLDMTVSATVRYSLVETKTRKEIYTRVIQSSHTASFSDSVLGPERLKIANEGAIKNNIQVLIEDLSTLKPN